MPPLAALAALIAVYGHSWTWRSQPPRPIAVESMVADVHRLAAARPGLVDEHYSDDPTLLYELNGVGESAGEPFRWPGKRGTSVCRTGGKPYDEVVTAALIRLGEFIPGDMLTIESDGSR